MINGKRISIIQFLEFSNWIVKIPMIQRDFAYGRPSEKENARSFVRNLIDAMSSNSEPIDLNFIYGSGSQKKEFFIIDGQQRFTVLFLLHWYISGWKNEYGKFKRLVLTPSGSSRFIYETRASSSEFSDALISSIKDLNSLVVQATETKSTIEEILEDQPWFFKSWRNDPTVVAILSILNIIQEELKTCSSVTNFDSNKITFQILDLDSYNLTDELYIKMNARGKSLSEYQNFKAYLHEIVEIHGDENIHLTDWSHKLDRQWLDLFWEYVDNKKNVENALLRFFQNILLYHFIDNTSKLDKKAEFLLHKLSNPPERFVNIVKQHELINIDYLNLCFATLEALVELDLKDSSKEIDNLISPHFSKTSLNDFIFNHDSKSVGLYDRVYYNSVLVSFRLERKCRQQKEVQKRWFRVLRNLIFNQNIDNNKRLFETLKSVISLEKQNQPNIDRIDLENVKGFPGIQIKEEILKKELIGEEDSDWKNLNL